MLTMARDDEAQRLTELLRGKTVTLVQRHRQTELVIQFADGTCLFVDSKPGDLEFSVTGGGEEE